MQARKLLVAPAMQQHLLMRCCRFCDELRAGGSIDGGDTGADRGHRPHHVRGAGGAAAGQGMHWRHHPAAPRQCEELEAVPACVLVQVTCEVALLTGRNISSFCQNAYPVRGICHCIVSGLLQVFIARWRNTTCCNHMQTSAVRKLAGNAGYSI